MQFRVTFVMTIVLFGNNVHSRPQVDLSGKSPLENATQQINGTAQNSGAALQNAFNNGVDLPTNLQNALQNLRNDTKNGADLPNLNQVLQDTATNQNLRSTTQTLPDLNQITQNLGRIPPAENAQSALGQVAQTIAGIPSNIAENGQNLAENIPSNLVPSNLGQLGQNLATSPVSSGSLGQAAQNIARIPSNIAATGQNLAQNVPQNLVPSNLGQTGQNFASQLPFLSRGNTLVPQNSLFPSTLNPSFSPSNLTSLFPNSQFGNPLPQFPSFPQSFPFSLNQSNIISPFGQNNSQLPSPANYPNLASAFNQTPAPVQSSSGFSPSNMSSFDLSEENGSQVTEQRTGNPQGNNRIKNLLNTSGPQLQPGSVLSNLHQFTHNQIQTTKDALKDTTRNLLDFNTLRNQDRRLLGQQQGLAGLLGNGGGLGLLSGNSPQPSAGTTTNNTPGNTLGSGLFGNSQGLGLGNSGGLLGFGRR